jgi:hypothetical protein
MKNGAHSNIAAVTKSAGRRIFFNAAYLFFHAAAPTPGKNSVKNGAGGRSSRFRYP